VEGGDRSGQGGFTTCRLVTRKEGGNKWPGVGRGGPYRLQGGGGGGFFTGDLEEFFFDYRKKGGAKREDIKGPLLRSKGGSYSPFIPYWGKGFLP